MKKPWGEGRNSLQRKARAQSIAFVMRPKAREDA